MQWLKDIIENILAVIVIIVCIVLAIAVCYWWIVPLYYLLNKLIDKL